MSIGLFGKSRLTRPLMIFLAVAIASIPLIDHSAAMLLRPEEASLAQVFMSILILSLGVALLVLGAKVRSTIQQLDRERFRLHTLFQSLAEGVVIQGPDGKIVECNPQAESILGLTRDRLLGRHPIDPRWQAVHEDGSPWPGEEHPAMITLRTGEPIRHAIMGIRLPNGDQRWLSINTQAISDTANRSWMVIASFTDVTAMRQQMDRLDLTISGAGLGTWDWNVATGEVVFNDIWARMLGYDLSEVEPNVRSWERIVDRSASAEVMRKLNDHLAGRTSDYRSEHRLKRKDGSWIWVLDTGRVVQRSSDGRPLRALGVHVDITLTKEMEQRLRESDRRFLAVFDQTFHLLWVLTTEGLIDIANQTALKFSQAALDEIIGRPLWQSRWLQISLHQQRDMRLAVERAGRGEFVRMELEIFSSQESRLVPRCIFDFSIKPVTDDDGRVTSLVAEAQDITEAVRTRETLRQAEDRLAHATRNANLGVWDWNPQTDEAWFSQPWFTMLGYSPDELPARGATWVQLLHPADAESTLRTLSRYLEGDLSQQQGEFRLEFRMRTKDDSWRWILSVGRVTGRDEYGRPTRVSGVHFDETERKSTQAQRAQAQRLESIGQLAAGVAHEINTPMQFVSDNLEYLVEGLEAAERVIDSVQERLVSSSTTSIEANDSTAEHDLREWLQRQMKQSGYERFRRESAGAVHDCRDGCQRVVTIVHAMRQLSHPGTEGFHSASLNDVITGATIVTRNRWKFVADVKLELDPDLPNIPCRAAELSQVFVNMLVNAADAMPEPEPGSGQLSGLITITSRLSNDAALVLVQDNGHGIAPQVIEKVFDPFFTTKPVGKGTGQGLAIAHDIIVNRHRGSLRVESEPGRGTTFIIELPLTQPNQHDMADAMVDMVHN